MLLRDAFFNLLQAQVPINAVTGEVKSEQNYSSDYATNQEFRIPAQEEKKGTVHREARTKTNARKTVTSGQQLSGFIKKFDSENAVLMRSVRRVLRKRRPSANERVYNNYNFFVECQDIQRNARIGHPVGEIRARSVSK